MQFEYWTLLFHQLVHNKDHEDTQWYLYKHSERAERKVLYKQGSHMSIHDQDKCLSHGSHSQCLNIMIILMHYTFNFILSMAHKIHFVLVENHLSWSLRFECSEQEIQLGHQNDYEQVIIDSGKHFTLNSLFISQMKQHPWFSQGFHLCQGTWAFWVDL